ncbi:MAG: hypothetical protein KC636_08930, partial [Myxococcales bacterium]|nr:hypothetical protein [Myxococcales bacterium]
MIFGSGRGRDRALAGLLALVGLAAVVGPIYLGARADGAATRLSGQVPVIGRPEYAGSDRCAACHPGEYASWRRSYHRTMTQLATPDVALGPFDGRTLHAPDGPYRVETRGDELWVELVDPAWKLEHLEAPIDVDDPPVDAPRVWRRVLMTTGSHHMQVYWVAGETPRSLLSFPFAYLAEEGRWVPNESTLLRPPMEGVVYTWNAVCIKCHAVAGQPRLGEDGALDRVDTRAAELGIACESCHGPAAAHVSQYRDPFARYARHGEARPEEGVIDPARLDHEAASELCGQCHAITRLVDESRWFDEGVEFRPGARLSTALRLVRHPVREVQPWLDDELEESPEFFARRFWPDGMVRVSGREFNGLAESPCYQRGQLSCLTCHSMHGGDPDDQLAPIARTGDVCLRCHEAYAAAPARAAHTHHAPGSSGDDCYSCHMPHTSYGLLKAIRSHEVSSPSVEESARFRRPNACNLCHLDR